MTDRHMLLLSNEKGRPRRKLSAPDEVFLHGFLFAFAFDVGYWVHFTASSSCVLYSWLTSPVWPAAAEEKGGVEANLAAALQWKFTPSLRL